ncbi:type IV pilus modification protein PilV [Pseudoxanthomonas beigongshangi]
MGGRRNATGAGLLEVLVAVLVMGIGLLGIAATQSTTLKYSQDSMGRSQAVIASYAMLDAIRVALPDDAATNPAARAQAIGAYSLSRACASRESGGSLVKESQQAWVASLQEGVGPGTCGTVECDGASGVCAITVEWDESRTGGATDNRIVTRSRI